MDDKDLDILGPEDNKKEDAKPDPVMESINALKSSLEAISGRFDALEQKFNQPAEEETTEEEVEHFVPKTWDDVPAKAEEIAEGVVERKLAEKEQEVEERKQAEDEERKQVDQYIDGQIASLETAGRLPKVVDPNNENDKGRSARRELFGYASRLQTIDLNSAWESLDLLHKSGYTFDPKANNMKGEYLRAGSNVPGFNSPVASSGRSTGAVSGKPTYEDLQKFRSLDAIVQSQMGDE